MYLMIFFIIICYLLTPSELYNGKVIDKTNIKNRIASENRKNCAPNDA